MPEAVTTLAQEFIEKADRELGKLKEQLDAGAKKAKERFEAEMEKLQPLQAQYDELHTMKNRLLGVNPTRKTARRASANGGVRRARGSRMVEFLGQVQAQPGKIAADYAKDMDIEPNYVYRLRKDALRDGTIRVEDGKVFPAEAAATAGEPAA